MSHLRRVICNPVTWIPGLVFLFLSFFISGCRQRPKGPPHGIPEVTVYTVRPEPVLLSTELPGRTVPFRVAEIRPQVSGLLKKRLFKEGACVKAGQPLYLIDPAEFEAALANAGAALAKAISNVPAIRSRVERYKKLLPFKAISRQEYDDAVAALGQARSEIKYWEAQVKRAKINLAYCHITAPISGRISRSYVTEGAILTAYQPAAMATIQRLDPIYVDVPQSTTELLRLRQRLKQGRIKYHARNRNMVRLVLEDGSIYPLMGILQFHEVNVDSTTGSVILRIMFKNPEGVLLPGMFVRAVIREGINPAAILVPQQAVSRTPKGEPFVFTVGKDNTVVLKMIKIDRAVGSRWLVSSGITPKDRIIVTGLQFIRPGIPVKVVASKNTDKKGAKGMSDRTEPDRHARLKDTFPVIAGDENTMRTVSTGSFKGNRYLNGGA